MPPSQDIRELECSGTDPEPPVPACVTATFEVIFLSPMNIYLYYNI